MRVCVCVVKHKNAVYDTKLCEHKYAAFACISCRVIFQMCGSGLFKCYHEGLMMEEFASILSI